MCSRQFRLSLAAQRRDVALDGGVGRTIVGIPDKRYLEVELLQRRADQGNVIVRILQAGRRGKLGGALDAPVLYWGSRHRPACSGAPRPCRGLCRDPHRGRNRGRSAWSGLDCLRRGDPGFAAYTVLSVRRSLSLGHASCCIQLAMRLPMPGRRIAPCFWRTALDTNGRNFRDMLGSGGRSQGWVGARSADVLSAACRHCRAQARVAIASSRSVVEPLAERGAQAAALLQGGASPSRALQCAIAPAFGGRYRRGCKRHPHYDNPGRAMAR